MGEWSRHIFISNGQLKKIWPYSLHKIEKGISILPQCYGWWWNNLLQTPDLAAYSWFYLCSDDFFSKNSNSSDFFGILSNCGLYLKGGFAKIFSPSVICKFSLGCVVFKKSGIILEGVISFVPSSKIKCVKLLFLLWKLKKWGTASNFF